MSGRRPQLIAWACGALLILTLFIAASSRNLLGFALWLLFLLVCPAMHLLMHRGDRRPRI